MSTADRASYTSGQTVNIELAMKNVGSVTCALGREPGMTIRDAAGKVVIVEGVADLCTFYVSPGPPPCVMAPGQVERYTGLTWSHTSCSPTGDPCAAGTYAADTSWGEIKAAPVAIVLS
jgi:hypothetical protein